MIAAVSTQKRRKRQKKKPFPVEKYAGSPKPDSFCAPCYEWAAWAIGQGCKPDPAAVYSYLRKAGVKPNISQLAYGLKYLSGTLTSADRIWDY
ncbi:hypothetical protein VZG28_14550 (plasmid) [Synechococcus elongatus IITB4]|uniref:hypothetical protein n=1 Tax=Synechococcus elongatus TaxID=32046 RepID=UPI0030D5ABB9